MPYITKERLKLIENNPERAKEPGDWNALYSTEFARILRERGIKYSTLHYIATCVEKTGIDPQIHNLTLQLKLHTKDTDLLVARQEALHELRRRVFFNYEDSKLVENDRIDPYKELLDPVENTNA